MNACDDVGNIDPNDLFDDCDGNYTSTPSISPAPSGIPADTPALSVSSAPTIDCNCCDCTHTSSCNPGACFVCGSYLTRNPRPIRVLLFSRKTQDNDVSISH